jgi:hypothetical protein
MHATFTRSDTVVAHTLLWSLVVLLVSAVLGIVGAITGVPALVVPITVVGLLTAVAMLGLVVLLVIVGVREDRAYVCSRR